jgi:hypothetical protein
MAEPLVPRLELPFFAPGLGECPGHEHLEHKNES